MAEGSAGVGKWVITIGLGLTITTAILGGLVTDVGVFTAGEVEEEGEERELDDMQDYAYLVLDIIGSMITSLESLFLAAGWAAPLVLIVTFVLVIAIFLLVARLLEVSGVAGIIGAILGAIGIGLSFFL